MNEKQTPVVRPTKKQRELLNFIARFITEHGYSPSYREIMSGLNYTSLATVALHVRNLIARGHLRKRDFSARSLELTNPAEDVPIMTNQITPTEEKWLVEKVQYRLYQAEQRGANLTERELQELATLLAALQILGLDTAAQSLQPRLRALQAAQHAHAASVG